MTFKNRSRLATAKMAKKTGNKTKWEIKREKRPTKRREQGKKPLIEALRIAPLEERQAARGKGKMVFYDGKERIEVNLFERICGYNSALQGIYKTHDGRLILLRGDVKEQFSMGDPMIRVMNLRKTKPGFEEEQAGWTFKSPDLGHMRISPKLERQGVARKAALKSVMHVRAGIKGIHKFSTNTKFVPVFEKLGYYLVGTPMKNVATMQKYTNHPKYDNLDHYHRIEAINPETGKLRIFTFKIKR